MISLPTSSERRSTQKLWSTRNSTSLRETAVEIHYSKQCAMQPRPKCWNVQVFFCGRSNRFFFRNISHSHTSRKKNSFGLSTLTVIAFSISKFNNLSPNQKIPVFQWKYPPNDSLFLLMAWNSREKNTRMTRGRSVKKKQKFIAPYNPKSPPNLLGSGDGDHSAIFHYTVYINLSWWMFF